MPYSPAIGFGMFAPGTWVQEVPPFVVFQISNSPLTGSPIVIPLLGVKKETILVKDAELVYIPGAVIFVHVAPPFIVLCIAPMLEVAFINADAHAVLASTPSKFAN